MFSSLETCSGCAADPGPGPGAELEAAPAAPAGCLSTEDLERRFVAHADQLDAQIGAIAIAIAPTPAPAARGRGKRAPAPAPTEVDYHAINALAKLCDVRCKYLRAAGELAKNREHEAVQRARELRDRELRGGRAPGVTN